MALNQTFKWLVMGLLSLTLCSCLGGTFAQQLARSMLMHGADKLTGAALNAKEKNDKLAAQKAPLKDTPVDPYKLAFINSAFEAVTPKVEPLPEIAIEEERPIQLIQETRLVQVEVWSLLVGDEKNRILEKARLQGSTLIPPKNEWQQWQIAVGAEAIPLLVKKSTKPTEAITFLVPPEIGKMHSGTKALVELSGVGELNVARYSAN
ncbi:MAG: hypothetical protein H0W85_02540 [Methylotenera sp.]|nr:hypothetical protein [Methylotenera sp.]